MLLLEHRQELGCQVAERERVFNKPCYLSLPIMYQSLLFFTAPVRPGNRMSIATPSSSDNTVAIIGGVVVAVVLIIAATIAVIVITVALVLKSRRSQFSPNQK